jgi:hypothetical protein
MLEYFLFLQNKQKISSSYICMALLLALYSEPSRLPCACHCWCPWRKAFSKRHHLSKHTKLSLMPRCCAECRAAARGPRALKECDRERQAADSRRFASLRGIAAEDKAMRVQRVLWTQMYIVHIVGTFASRVSPRVAPFSPSCARAPRHAWLLGD